MKILHLIDTGGPGGAETIFLNSTAEFLRRENAVVAVVPRSGWLTERLIEAGIKPVIVQAKGSFNIRYLLRLRALVRDEGCSILHTHLLGSAVYGAALALITGLPLLCVFHGPTDFKNPGKLWPVKKWLIGRVAKRLVAVSESTKDALLGAGFPGDKVLLIRNGVDVARYQVGSSVSLKKEIGLSEEELLVGAVGNIRPPKAYEVLVRAAAKVCKERAGVHFAVVGQGSARDIEKLTALAESLNVAKNVHFLGFRRSATDLFWNFDIFVSSSSTEGLSLSFLEAMATGRCIVATRSGGAQEALGAGNAGLLVPTNDPESLADALLAVIDDPPRRNQMSANARARVVRYFDLRIASDAYAAAQHALLE